MSDHDCSAEAPSYPFNPWGLLYNVAVFSARVLHEAAGFAGVLATDFGAHNNALMARRQEREMERWEEQNRVRLIDDLRSLETGQLTLDDVEDDS